MTDRQTAIHANSPHAHIAMTSGVENMTSTMLYNVCSAAATVLVACSEARITDIERNRGV